MLDKSIKCLPQTPQEWKEWRWAEQDKLKKFEKRGSVKRQQAQLYLLVGIYGDNSRLLFAFPSPISPQVIDISLGDPLFTGLTQVADVATLLSSQ